MVADQRESVLPRVNPLPIDPHPAPSTEPTDEEPEDMPHGNVSCDSEDFFRVDDDFSETGEQFAGGWGSFTDQEEDGAAEPLESSKLYYTTIIT